MKTLLTLVAVLVLQPSASWAAEVEIGEGLTPARTSEQVAAQVVGMLGSPVQGIRQAADGTVTPVPAAPEVVSMTLVRGSEIRSALPEAGIGSLPYNQVWVVRAKGNFVNLRTSRAGQPSRATAGFFVIDDANGKVVARGSFAEE